MSPTERVHRWLAIAAALVWLCLALIGAGARASSSARPEVRVSPAAAVASQGIPAALDCMPYALSYVALAPSSQVVTAEAKEFESFVWWVPVPAEPAEHQFLSTLDVDVPRRGIVSSSVAEQNVAMCLADRSAQELVFCLPSRSGRHPGWQAGRLAKTDPSGCSIAHSG